ncbi:MAG: dTMP kinase [Candidatus Freyarchaeota archaeon]|nr:dTMP kinase [Candidatus Jordarchaeia archaeon]
MKRGVLIVLEGIDGAGKTTHAKLLTEWLREEGYIVSLTKEPTSGEIGSLIRKQLQRRVFHPATLALLFAADRLEHAESELKPRIEAGEVIVSDRYVESSICYQAAEGVDVEWIEDINKWALNADLTILLDVDAQTAMERMGSKFKDKFEEESFLERVRKIYLERAKEKGYLVIDATPPVEDVQMKIRRIVASFMKNCENFIFKGLKVCSGDEEV